MNMIRFKRLVDELCYLMSNVIPESLREERVKSEIFIVYGYPVSQIVLSEKND